MLAHYDQRTVGMQAYQLEGGFKPGDSRGTAFAVERRSAGAQALRDMIVRCLVESEHTPVGYPTVHVRDRSGLSMSPRHVDARRDRRPAECSHRCAAIQAVRASGRMTEEIAYFRENFDIFQNSLTTFGKPGCNHSRRGWLHGAQPTGDEPLPHWSVPRATTMRSASWQP